MNLTFIDAKLGKTFADRLKENVISLLDVKYTRHEVVTKLDCPNLIAAARLDKNLKLLGIRTVRELAHLDPMNLYRVKHVGDAQVYVAMCLLEKNGINVDKWWGWNVKGGSLKRKAKELTFIRRSKDLPRAAAAVADIKLVANG